MKKRILVILLLFVFCFSAYKTYSLLCSITTIDVKSSSSNIVCDAEITTSTNKFGYSEFKIIVKNYNTANTITKLPFTYTINIEKNGTNNVFFGTNNTFNQVNTPLTLSGEITSLTKETKEHLVQVKTDKVASEKVDYKVSVDCMQKE